MNKKIFSYMTIAALLGGMSSCSMEQPFSVGEGTMFISTRINSDVVVETRSETEDELAASTKVWIYSDEGVVRKYDGMSEVPATGLKLIAGNYTVKAWAGNLTYASFEDRWFEGEKEVTIESGKSTSVDVVCKIANVVASVNYADDIDEYITDYSMAIFHKGGSLTYEGNDPDLKGYFIMPDDVTALNYALTFKTEGEEKIVTGSIQDVQPAHHYILNVNAKKEYEQMEGAAFIVITVDDTMTEVNDEIVISTPPAITGYGFDISSPVAGESGSIGRKSIYVAATSAVSSLQLKNLPGLDGITEVDFFNAADTYISDLKNAGIFHEITNFDNGSQLVKVVFEDTYLDALPNSDDPYIINISAADSAEPNHKTVSATLTLRISEAPVVTGVADESLITYTSVTLSAQIATDGVEEAGFEYAQVGSSTWTYVEGAASRAAYTKGQTYYATISDLEVNTTYKFRATSGSGDNIYRGDEVEFTTANGPQLPNSGFENWCTDSSNVIIPNANSTDEAWDTGNHGAKLASAILTQGVTTYKHGGNKSAELVSQKAALFGIGKFAAGNIFYGKYLKTDGTDGVIGFGRTFDFPTSVIKPIALRLWVKYTPSDDWEGKSNLPDEAKDLSTDVGHIFVALFDGADEGDSEYTGYGFVVRTKNSSSVVRRLFDKTASNVMAYGEKVFTEATSGNDLVEIEIPIEYYSGKENTIPTHIAVVCTASRYGDYFAGGKGSTMYVDDVEIVYGKK